jgi:hypothetical protein
MLSNVLKQVLVPKMTEKVTKIVNSSCSVTRFGEISTFGLLLKIPGRGWGLQKLEHFVLLFLKEFLYIYYRLIRQYKAWLKPNV